MKQNLSDISPLHRQELKEIANALAKLVNRSPEEITPYLNALINRLGQTKENDLAEASFYETSTHEEWSAEFHSWVDSHKGEDIPVLSDEAMSRESMYPDRW